MHTSFLFYHRAFAKNTLQGIQSRVLLSTSSRHGRLGNVSTGRKIYRAFGVTRWKTLGLLVVTLGIASSVAALTSATVKVWTTAETRNAGDWQRCVSATFSHRLGPNWVQGSYSGLRADIPWSWHFSFRLKAPRRSAHCKPSLATSILYPPLFLTDWAQTGCRVVIRARGQIARGLGSFRFD